MSTSSALRRDKKVSGPVPIDVDALAAKITAVAKGAGSEGTPTGWSVAILAQAISCSNVRMMDFSASRALLVLSCPRVHNPVLLFHRLSHGAYR